MPRAVVCQLELYGYHPVNHRGVYGFIPAERRQVDVEASR